MAKQVRVLIVGVGSIGQRHVRCFQNTGRADVVIVELNGDRRHAVASQYGIVEAYDSLDAAMGAARPFDVAVVCTPANQHVSVALRLARAGVHLLIEKPLSTTLQDVNALCQVVVEQELVSGVAYVYRHHPALAAMRDAITQGRFGRPVQLVATCGQHFPTYRPVYRDIYYADHRTGGGAIQDALTHIINAGQWLVGPVERLAADADHLVLPDVTVEDTVHVLTRQGSVLGSYSLNQHQAPNEVIISVICENGTTRFEYHKSRWRWMSEPDGPWHNELTGSLERDELFMRQADQFLDALERRMAPACSIQQALHTLHVNLAILEAVQSRTWHPVPLAPPVSASHVSGEPDA